MTNHPAPPAAPHDLSRGPVQLWPASFQRAIGGAVTAVFAGHAPVAEGQSVIVVDGHFQSFCSTEGAAMAEEVLTAAQLRFIQSGGHNRFDELARQLQTAYNDVETARALADGYASEAKTRETAGAPPAEVVRWQGYAADEKAKGERVEREIPVLVRQLAQERELVRSLLAAALRDALTAFQNEHFAKSAQLERQALAAFLPKYAAALKERFLARGADRGLLEQVLSRVALAEPKPPAAEQPPPPIVPNFAALMHSLR